MEINIGEPIIKPEYKDIYKINLVAMHGDGDAYETILVYVTPKYINEFLEDFLELLLLDNHEVVEAIGSSKFSRWVDTGSQADNNPSIDTDNIWIDWPLDASNENRYCALAKSEITYFDSDGVEREVIIK